MNSVLIALNGLFFKIKLICNTFLSFSLMCACTNTYCATRFLPLCAVNFYMPYQGKNSNNNRKKIYQMNIKLRFRTMWKRRKTSGSEKEKKLVNATYKNQSNTKYLWKLKIKTAFLLTDYNAFFYESRIIDKMSVYVCNKTCCIHSNIRKKISNSGCSGKKCISPIIGKQI